MLSLQVRSTVTSVISSGNKVSETINSLFSTCSSDSTEPQRRVIFETCIKALNTGAGERLQTQVAKDIIGKLLLKVREKLWRAKSHIRSW